MAGPATIMVALETVSPVPVAPSNHDVLALFCRALNEVVRLERRPISSSVEFVMRTWHPQLDLPSIGFADVDALAAEAERCGFIRRVVVGHKILLQPREASPAGRQPDYRAFLEWKLRCPLPRAPIRARIYALTAACLDERRPQMPGLSLLDLSYRVAGRLDGAARQHSVFKLLFALVLGGGFVFVHHPRSHDIRVRAAACPAGRWDTCFASTCIVGIRRDHPEWPLDPDELARALDLPRETIETVLRAANPHAALTMQQA